MTTWEEARKSGIGCSEIAAILGLSPWATPWDIWAEKTGRLPMRGDSFRLRIGRLMEPIIAQLYAEREGVTLGVIAPPGVVRHENVPLVGTPDRIVIGQNKGLEIKTADPSVAWLWGPPGTDEIPVYYATQTAGYMAITGYDQWDVAVLFGTTDFRVYRCRRDPEIEQMLLEQVGEFWQKYVIADKPPPAEGSDRYRQYLLRRYRAAEKVRRQATERESDLLRRLAATQNRLADLEEQKARLAMQIMEAIGSGYCIEAPSIGKAIWTLPGERRSVDWASLAQRLLARYPKEEADAMLAEHTTKRNVDRRLIFYPAQRRPGEAEKYTASDADELAAIGRRQIIL